MKATLLAKKLRGKKVRCLTCQRHCLVSPGKWGFCQTRINRNGRLYSVIYGVVSSINLDPIEKKPVYHFQPGSLCLSLGTYGCNFRCQFCQNWSLSQTNGASINFDREKLLSPTEAIKIARRSGAAGITWTYNEPAIWLEYSLATAKLAKKADLYTCWVTNGYATKEAIDKVAPYLDIYRVDLKSFTDRLYKKLIGVPQAKGVFQMTKYVRDKYPQIHLECVTNVIPTWNDSENNLKQIARWIIQNLGPETPWHVTRFFPASSYAIQGGPHAELGDVPPTSPETLYRTRKMALKEGLQFVYLGNLPVDKEDDTFCPQCHNLAIRRHAYRTETLAVDQTGHCQDCGQDLNIKK